MIFKVVMGILSVCVALTTIDCVEASERKQVADHYVGDAQAIVAVPAAKGQGDSSNKPAPTLSLSEERIAKFFPPVIAAFQSGDRQRIAQVLAYPYERRYPVKAIDSAEEMLQRFDEVFDAQLIHEVGRSNVSDWSRVGWRGVMFKNGLVWATEQGQITAVNWATAAGEKAVADAIAKEKAFVHPSLKTFKSPVLSWNSDRFNIRIDDMGDFYRYAVWPGSKPQSSKPDLILNKGSVSYEGSGNYFNFTFKNGNYVYLVSEAAVDNVAGYIVVEREGQEILSHSFKVEDVGINIPDTVFLKRLSIAKIIAASLSDGSLFKDLNVDSVQFAYEKYFRSDGETKSTPITIVLSDLWRPMSLDIVTDNKGWGYDQEADPVPEPTHGKYVFDLVRLLKYWDEFVVSNNIHCTTQWDFNCESTCKLTESNTGNIFYIFGGGASEHITLEFGNVDGVDRLINFTYSSIDPG